jgi:hypothetical protein
VGVGRKKLSKTINFRNSLIEIFLKAFVELKKQKFLSTQKQLPTSLLQLISIYSFS